mgnify:CR=1 FL=1|jgi:C4-dicarboxylate-specific signal transduction histidine kinase
MNMGAESILIPDRDGRNRKISLTAEERHKVSGIDIEDLDRILGNMRPGDAVHATGITREGDVVVATSRDPGRELILISAAGYGIVKTSDGEMYEPIIGHRRRQN